jgi:hypothetical protein
MQGLMKIARLSLYFFALGFLGFGLLFMAFPTALTPLAEITLPTSIALMEIRGVYGGFFLGGGFFCCCAHGARHGFDPALQHRQLYWVA